MKPLYFKPNMNWVILIILVYLVCLISYYLYTDIQEEYVVYTMLLSLSACFTILLVCLTRRVIISEHTITHRRFGRTVTTSFYKIRSVTYKKSPWYSGRYICIEYANEYGLLDTMNIGGDYNIDTIYDLIEKGRHVA